MFERALNKVIELEGGYVVRTVSGDRGGMTFAGISRVANPSWPGWSLIDAGRINDAKGLVASFYRGIWDALKCDQFDWPVALSLFDAGVNHGIKPAVRMAQAVAGARVDGLIGPDTIGKIRACRDFPGRYALARARFYARICERDPSQVAFLEGWINRLAALYGA